MNLSSEDRALLALRLAKGIGARTLEVLVERFGCAEKAVHASADELAEIPYLGRDAAQALRRAWAHADVDAEVELMAQHGVRLFRQGGPGYPATLHGLPGMPHLLYVRGELTAADERAIALVGSRSCTPYGRRLAQRIAHDLARAGWTVVSGLARGIDAEAHRGALEAGGRTVAVLANGLSRVYPPEHAELADQVAAAGALVSEACMRMEPLAGMFPARNRIITGLCRAVVVIEAGDRSGALISARHAGEQGREVYVVPANVDSVASAGSLQLLRDGARLVRNARDVLEDLEGLSAKGRSSGNGTAASPPRPPLDGVAAQVWDALGEPLSVDELCRRIGQSVADLSLVLTNLEMDGRIRKSPGNIYERC